MRQPEVRLARTDRAGWLNPAMARTEPGLEESPLFRQDLRVRDWEGLTPVEWCRVSRVLRQQFRVARPREQVCKPERHPAEWSQVRTDSIPRDPQERDRVELCRVAILNQERFRAATSKARRPNREPGQAERPDTQRARWDRAAAVDKVEVAQAEPARVEPEQVEVALAAEIQGECPPGVEAKEEAHPQAVKAATRARVGAAECHRCKSAVPRSRGLLHQVQRTLRSRIRRSCRPVFRVGRVELAP
jgi:hypothetical protein